MLLKGNCLELLAEMPDNSVDSIVTDPPYELGFMGKSWDNSGIAYNVELWSQVLRVLKPGGHLLAFGGSRTYHRLASAVEDAGFEIRDQIMWLYGSGFPKSLDVSKAIDKNNGEPNRLLKFTEWMRTTGLKAKELDAATGTNMGGHYLTTASQPAIPTVELWGKIRPLIADVPEWVDELVQRIEAEREVVGTKDSNLLAVAPGQNNDRSATTLNITAPSTPEAQQWEGWGTALKPAHEPIVVARKPLIGTVATNVLTYGTGALNIDGSRVGTGTGETKTVQYPDIRGNNYNNAEGTVEYTVTDQGRWPANVIHDGSEEVLEYFGEPQRFFYCAKASKSERNAGLGGLPKQEQQGSYKFRTDGSLDGKETEPKANIHPTVKPISLMRYLVKLVTPPNGTVLDPFLGSGTTTVAAILEGFNWMGCEMTEDYWPIIEARVVWAEAQPKTLL